MVKKITELPKELKPPKPPLTFEGALTALNDPAISSEEWVKTYSDVYKAGKEPTPIEPVAPLEPIALPQTPDELFSLMETVLPEMTAGFGFTREELIPQALENLEILAQERPEDLITQLRERGRTPESETLLSMLGATPEDIDLIFEEEPFIEPPPPEVEPVVVELDGIRQMVTRTEDNSLYDTNGNWIGYYNWADGTVFNPYKAEGLAGKALASFTAGIGDILSTSGGVARRLGYDDVASKLSTVASQLQLYGVPSSSFETSDLLSPEFYATKITRTIPFALSLAPLAIGGFYGGTALATAAGLGTVWTMVVGGLTGAALSRPLESAMEAGGSYDDAIARGKTHEEASAEFDEVFRNNMLLVGADAWEIAIALAPTPKWVPVSLIKAGLVRTARIAGKMVIVGLSEGGEEIYQDMVQRHARGEEWKLDPVSKEVFAIGFVMGAGMGLGGDVISGIVDSSKNKMPSRMRKDFDDSVTGFEAEGFRLDQSELKALDEVAKTPEGEVIVQDALEILARDVGIVIGEEVKEAKPEVPAEVISPQKELIKLDAKAKDLTREMEQALLLQQDEKAANLRDEIQDIINQMKPLEKQMRKRPGRVVVEELTAKLEELGIPVTPEVVEVKPPKAPEIPEERVVTQEGGEPVSPDEPIPQGIVDNIPIIQDIGAKEIFRPVRKVFERMGLYETYKGIQKAEVELGEARKAFGERLKEVSKLVDKNRRNLVFQELENPGTVVGLTFNEKRAVSFFRENFNKWADKLNLPQEKRLENYVTHIFEADIAEQLKAKHPLNPAIARALEYKTPKTIFNPFLQKRLGATVGLIEDPFAAALAYESRQLQVFYYEPFLQKISAIANDKDTPRAARSYLKNYARRMTGEPSKLDLDINTTLQEFAEKLKVLPGGEALANYLSRGNPSGMAAYNFTSALYTLWLGFKPTSAIRNLSQHTLIIGEVGPVHFANGIRLRFTKEGKQVLKEALAKRSRKAAFVPGIDDSFAEQWIDKFREIALFMFRGADAQNVSNATLAGYSEAKKILTDANEKLPIDKKLSQEELREFSIERGDEVSADTQYLYTKMNSMAISQSAPGRVFSVLTTWSENWIELMAKWIARRPSQVYLKFEKRTGAKVAGANWATSYKAILMYMAIIGLGYALKERTRLKAWEYTGLTSIRYLADIVGGDFPGLQAPGAVADMIAGFITDDERRLKIGWANAKSTFTPSILKQLEGVATGEKDWLTLFLYLEGQNYEIKKLKDTWEKGWESYPLFETPEDKTKYIMAHPKQAGWSDAKMQKQWRMDNPKLEAQMFITNRFTTLSTEKARAEVLRIIEQHKLDTELIQGYEKVFGVDTSEELIKFKNRIGNLEKLVVGEEAEYFTTNNFASEVNRLVKTQGRSKVQRDGDPLTVEYLLAKDSFVQYDMLEADDARVLFRQQFPDVEAQLYLWGKVASFKNPKSAELLLGLMKKYNIPPEGIQAFIDKPERYDELFTQKFKLEQKWFDLTTEYENYGNPESDIYLEDADVRKETRDKLKENNPNWVSDMRRIDAIDKDASPEITERWVDRGKTIDKFGAGSSQAMVWLLDNPDTFKWALDNKLLTDDGSDWNETVLRINTKWEERDNYYNTLQTNTERQGFLSRNEEYRKDRRRREAYSDGFVDALIEDFVAYYELPVAGYRQERFLLGNRAFGEAMQLIKGIDMPDESKIPAIEYDELLEKHQSELDKYDELTSDAKELYLEKHPQFAEVRLRIDAYKLFFPKSLVEDYVTYRSMEKPEDVDLWYEDDWFLIEHREFYQTSLRILEWERADFRTVPSRKVFDKYKYYLTLPHTKAKDDYRLDNRDLDDWGQVKFGWVDIAEKKYRELTALEKLKERQAEEGKKIEEMKRRLARLTE